MRIKFTKQTLPRLKNVLTGIKAFDLYNVENYAQTNHTLVVPDTDISIDSAIDIQRAGATIEAYPYWVEVPNANLNDDLPEGLSYREYEDQSGTVIRKWSDLIQSAANFAGTATLRYWQPANNHNFIVNDMEVIAEANIATYDASARERLLNKDYEDTGAPEYQETETVKYIDDNWISYPDFIAAHITMKEVYDSKGANDNARWQWYIDNEPDSREILVRWNQVGLGKAQTIFPPTWSENRKLKEVGLKYKELDTNRRPAVEQRFNDYWLFLTSFLSSDGEDKLYGVSRDYGGNWDDTYRFDYIRQFKRHIELDGRVNLLVNFHQTVIANYTNDDFLGNIPASTFINNLEQVLIGKSYSGI